MSKKKYIVCIAILSVIFIAILTYIIIRIPISIKEKEKASKHYYITTTIVEKNIEEGYNCGWYCYVPTQYIIVSIDANGNRYTNYVDNGDYYNSQIGDTITICTNHNKIKEYE